jgi:hypothetical protein
MSQIKSMSRRMAIAALAALSATPTIAGEITGNGKPIDINGRSECAFSGRNDTPEGDPMDPGGVAQSYGYFSGYWDLWDPQTFDPHTDFLIPGFACNPNRGADLNE